jgi:hypothetical protein
MKWWESLSLSLFLSLSLSLSEIKKERERERERKKEKETEKKRDREREREKERERKRERKREREREIPLIIKIIESPALTNLQRSNFNSWVVGVDRSGGMKYFCRKVTTQLPPRPTTPWDQLPQAATFRKLSCMIF